PGAAWLNRIWPSSALANTNRLSCRPAEAKATFVTTPPANSCQPTKAPPGAAWLKRILPSCRLANTNNVSFWMPAARASSVRTPPGTSCQPTKAWPGAAWLNRIWPSSIVAKTMLDGQILFNQAAPGQAFVGWQEVPGGVRTDEALAS